jgi:phenylacetic acid degradation operon negative regulatory protein
MPLDVSPATWTPWRRGENTSSARALLLTVLGEFVLADGGAVWTSTLIEALGALEVEPKTSRQAIARSASGGLLTATRTGRQVRWGLTPVARQLLTTGTERIYGLGRPQEPWDGRWVVILVSVPESNRRLRYRLRLTLGGQGFGLLAPGVWVCPWVDREPAAVALLHDLGLGSDAISFVGEPGSAGVLDDRIFEVWDLAGVASEYGVFVEATTAKAPTTVAEAFIDLATLVHDWRHFPAVDPGLPDRLLPRSWPGHAAAGVFHRCHEQWRPAAWEWWRLHAGESRAPALTAATSRSGSAG